MPLSYFDGTADTGAVVEALRRDGAVVVTNLAEPRLVDTIRAELRQRLDASGLKSRSDFNGSWTLRSNSVLSKAPSAADLVDHDMLVGVADAILLPHCGFGTSSNLCRVLKNRSITMTYGWRRGWDSNPRYARAYNGFRVC